MSKLLTLILIVLCLSTANVFGESDATQSQQTAIAAPASPKVDTGDTAWVLISAALVMLMTPGLAFFYGGLVRRKNVLGILMQCFIVLAILSIQLRHVYNRSFQGLVSNFQQHKTQRKGIKVVTWQ